MLVLLLLLMLNFFVAVAVAVAVAVVAIHAVIVRVEAGFPLLIKYIFKLILIVQAVVDNCN